MPSADFIRIKKIESSEFHSVGWAVRGDLGVNFAGQTMVRQSPFGVQNESGFVLAENWNRSVFDKIAFLKQVVPTFGPRQVLQSATDGFANDPRNAERSEWEWGPQDKRFWEEALFQDTKNGLVCSLIWHIASGGGGTMGVDEAAVKNGLATFPKAHHVLLEVLPVHNRKHWRNYHLKGYEDYPNNLGLPTIIGVNNPQLDWIFAAFMTINSVGYRIKQGKPHSVAENVQVVTGQHLLGTLAGAQGELAVVPVPWYVQLSRKLLRVDYPTIAEQALPEVLSDTIVASLQKDAEMIDAPQLDPDMPQVCAAGGIGAVFEGQQAIQRVQEIEDATKKLVRVKLARKNQPYPEGMEYVWAPLLLAHPTNPRIARVPVVRLRPIPDKTPRHYVDTLLR